MIKVMHVDGDSETREMVDMVLYLTGEFVVMPCETGAEAVEQLSVFGPEVILIDTPPTTSDATNTMAAIHSKPEFQDTPIIFMTPDGTQGNLTALQDAGAADVISKPFDPMGLADRIKGALPAYA